METLKTERLILRRLQKDSDRQEILSILNDIKVGEYVPNLYFKTLDELNIYLEASFDYKNEFFFIIEDIVSKKLVGIIESYLYIGYVAHTSYIIKSEYRGKGYMPEAVKAFAYYMYDNGIASSISFSIDKKNHSSKKVMKKLKIKVAVNTPKFYHYSLSLSKRPSF